MKALRWQSAWVRWIGGVLLSGVAFVALVGFMHTEAGRPLLHLFAKAAGCPVNLDGADPKRVEAYRVERLRERSGVSNARSAAALEFELGRSTRRDVNEWARRVAASCNPARHDSVLQCSVAATPGTLAISDLHLQFDAQDRLVAVDLFRSESCSEDAILHLKSLTNSLAERVGPATAKTGKLSAAYLSSPYRRAAFEYRYKDYRATVSATNLDAHGVRVREQYQWAPPGTATPPS